VREDLGGDALKVEKIVENISQIHFQVQETLNMLGEKYKARHDKHITEKTFKVGDMETFGLLFSCLPNVPVHR
jgi:hypothetical protein